MAKQRTKTTAEFGDFQTPTDLAILACNTLAKRMPTPASIVEPTCGKGSFLVAGLQRFPSVSKVVGIEVNEAHIDHAMKAAQRVGWSERIQFIHADFFRQNWRNLLSSLPEPILVLGNPPWVTNSQLSVLGSKNAPRKSNFQNLSGCDAITGKSNFDVSEWMLINLMEWLNGRDATIAILCKTAVARKVLHYAWKHRIRISRTEVHLIDAQRYFDAAVDACFLVCRLTSGEKRFDCPVFQCLGEDQKSSVFGFREGQLIADVETYERLSHLDGKGAIRWRSGIKHDCAKVMEFRREGVLYRNGLGELCDLEDEYLYPLLKGSQLANGSVQQSSRLVLITQRAVGQDTTLIRDKAPKTWRYLLQHGELLDRRASSIYRNRPRFSVFGVGSYTFAPWKVAISGFYKKLSFSFIGGLNGKPIVVDDTCYFLPCKTKGEARLLYEMLQSPKAQQFYSSLIFWDSKRPITVGILERLDLHALAQEEHAPQAAAQQFKRSMQLELDFD